MRHLDDIVRIVCQDLGVKPERVRATPGKRAYSKKVIAARLAIVYAARRCTTQASYPALAQALGFASHGTVLGWRLQQEALRPQYPNSMSASEYAASVAERAKGGTPS